MNLRYSAAVTYAADAGVTIYPGGNYFAGSVVPGKVCVDSVTVTNDDDQPIMVRIYDMASLDAGDGVAGTAVNVRGGGVITDLDATDMTDADCIFEAAANIQDAVGGVSGPVTLIPGARCEHGCAIFVVNVGAGALSSQLTVSVSFTRL